MRSLLRVSHMSEYGPEETREQRYHRQTEESFASLGRYVQEFEGMVDVVRQGCIDLLGGTELAQVVMHGQAFTAYPLMVTLRAMLMTVFKNNSSAFSTADVEVAGKLLAHIQNSLQNATNARNALLHGTWYIGYTSEDQNDFSDVRVYKGKITGSGMQMDQVVKSSNDLLNLSEECRRIKTLVQKLITCTHLCLGLGAEQKPGFYRRKHFPQEQAVVRPRAVLELPHAGNDAVAL